MTAANARVAGGAVDRPAETLPDEVAQVAAVVDVGVAEEHRVDVPGAERELAVASMAFGPVPLEEAAVEQQ